MSATDWGADVQTFYLGVDPGLGGGLALIASDATPDDVVPMPKTDHDLAEFFSALYGIDAIPHKTFAIIERVHAMPKNGSISAFKLGQSYGTLRGLLAAFEIPYTEVSSSVWKRHHGLIAPAGATDTVKKNLSKAKAQQLFPNLKITHAIADALLIAEYGRAKGLQENR